MRSSFKTLSRTTVVMASIAAALTWGCAPSGDEVEVGRATEALVSDGAHGGNPHFYFLPPLVSNPSPTGVFADTLAPEVAICEWNGAACATNVASFSMTTGPGSETVRVVPVDEHYIVNWHTDQFALVSGQSYRIRVSVLGTEVGFIDALVGSAKLLKDLNTGEDIELVDGKTLPIKFRIEIGCGNGAREANEACDGKDLGGSTCIAQGFDGGVLGCTPACTMDTSACYRCGDGVKNGDEQCDGGDFGGETCQSQGFDGGALVCSSSCTLQTGGCHKCGDGVIEGPEQCEGEDLGGATCESQGFDGGTLACSSSCTLQTGGCHRCGDGVIEGPEQCDRSCTMGAMICTPPSFGNETCVSLGFDGGTLGCTWDCTFNLDGCTIDTGEQYTSVVDLLLSILSGGDDQSEPPDDSSSGFSSCGGTIDAECGADACIACCHSGVDSSDLAAVVAAAKCETACHAKKALCLVNQAAERQSDNVFTMTN
jgi:hypothetical protein